MKKADEHLFREMISEKIIRYYNDEVFSAASVSLCFLDSGKKEKKRLTVEYNKENNVSPGLGETVFDLASLTKSLVTLPCLLHLIDKKQLTWHDTVGDVFRTGPGKSLSRVTIEMLASHSSGLPAHRDYASALIDITPERRKQWLLESIFREIIDDRYSGAVLYSDLGYILLGLIVETVTGRSLDTFWSSTIAQAVGVEKNLFFPGRGLHADKKYAETGPCRFTSQQLAGRVHDDNCRLLGGVCGHAGLFGTSTAVLRVAEEMLALYRGEKTSLPLSETTFRTACKPVGSSDWSRGFQLPTPGNSSSGRYFSVESFGHLGFTGTSFWVDPVRQLIVVILTNRVVKGEDKSAIQTMRPALHDSIVEFLKEKQ